MELAGLLMRQLASMFLMMAIGYLMVKLKLLKQADSKTLSVLLIYVISPCTIFSSYQIAFNTAILQGLMVAILCAVGIHLVFFGVITVLRKTNHLNGIERASIMYVNAGNMIIPLVSAALGPEWVIYTTAYILVETPLIWTHSLSTVKGEREYAAKRIFTNVNMIAVLLGLLFFLLNWRLPPVLSSTVSALGSMIAPVNMLMFGVLMAGSDLRELFSRPKAYFVCAVRLLACPLIVIVLMALTGVAHSFSLGKQVLLISLLSAAAPTGATVTQLAQLYDKEPAYAGTINILTCLFCVVTIPVMAYLYQLLV